MLIEKMECFRDDGSLDIEKCMVEACMSCMPRQLRVWAVRTRAGFSVWRIFHYFSVWNLVLCAVALTTGMLGDHAVVSSVICSVFGGCFAWIHPRSTHVFYLNLYLGSVASPIMDIVAHQVPTALVLSRFCLDDPIRSHLMICVYLVVMNRSIARLYGVSWAYISAVACLYVIMLCVMIHYPLLHPRLWSLPLLSMGRQCSA